MKFGNTKTVVTNRHYFCASIREQQCEEIACLEEKIGNDKLELEGGKQKRKQRDTTPVYLLGLIFFAS